MAPRSLARRRRRRCRNLVDRRRCGGVGAINYRPPAISELDVANRPIEVPADSYVSSKSCRACHAHEYATWHASYHRTMTQVAGPDAIAGEFDGVELNRKGHKYRLERRGDEFWIEMDDPDWEGDGASPPRVERRVVMTTGSHNLQTCWFETGRGRELGQLPFYYHIGERRWIAEDATYLHAPPAPDAKFSVAGPGDWEVHCIKCHTTHGRPLFDPAGLTHPDTRVAEFGISCEACHGPAEEHVRVNRDPKRRYQYHLSGAADETIVQPERLPHRKSAQICGQCHSVSLLDQKRWEQWIVKGFPFRPGDELDDTRVILRQDHEHSPVLRAGSFWSDGMIRISGREYNGLLRTPCYQRGEMSCLSCHGMHKPADGPRPLKEWADDQLKLGMDGDQACLQCHDSFAADLAAHTHHKADSSGSRCYNCHMPYTTYGLLKAIRSHEVDSPTVSASLATGRPNACNQCHLDKTLAWAADHLERWYQTPIPALTDDEASIAASVLWAVRGDAGQRA